MKNTSNKGKRVLSFLLSLIMILTLLPNQLLMASEVQSGDTCMHTEYENGFCKNCDAYEQPTGSGTDEDPYLIDNAGKLYWFSAVVNGGYGSVVQNLNANAKLVKDIRVNENVLKDDGTLRDDPENLRVWVPIGEPYYGGTFDGDGHTISGLYVNDSAKNGVGLFKSLYSATVQKVGVVDSYLCGAEKVGGIAGAMKYGSVAYCFSSSTVIANNSVGGLVGFYNSNQLCYSYSTGIVNGTTNYGGIIGSVDPKRKTTVVSCCYLDTSVGAGNNSKEGIVAMTAGEFTSGKAAYYLNGNTSSETSVWRQTLGENGNTMPSWQGEIVYSVYTSCAESSQSFSNDSSKVGTRPAHTIQEGDCDTAEYCTACNETLGEPLGHDLDELGFCRRCEPTTVINGVNVTLKDSDDDGYFEIGNADELYAFAALVNGGNATIKVELTTNIVVNEDLMTNLTMQEDGILTPVNGANVRSWTPVNNYAGIFDGAGHSISGLYYCYSDRNTGWLGFIANLKTGGAVCNLGLEDFYFYVRFSRLGGIVGSNSGVITDCYSSGTCVTRGLVGGIASINSGTIRNCWSATEIQLEVEGFSSGIVSSSSSNAVVENCYYLEGSCTGGIEGVDYVGRAEAKTADAFTSGEVTYLLNQGQTEDTVWYQTLGENGNAYPSYAGDVVYAYYISCSLIAYTNETVENTAKPACESIVNGFCPNCGSYEAAVFNNNGTPDDPADDYYEISNAGQLYWFAAVIENGYNEMPVDPAINGVLNADITVNLGTFDENGQYTPLAAEVVREWSPIGRKFSRYSGSFDGRGHKIYGLYMDNAAAEYVGLFGYLTTGASVENTGVVNSYFNGKRYVGGIAGYSDGGSIRNCYYAGALQCAYSYTGGIAGYSNYSIISNCYYLDTACTGGLYGADSIGQTEPVTAEQFASGEVTWLLNGERSVGTEQAPLIWYQILGEEGDAYPSAEGGTVYCNYVSCAEVHYTNEAGGNANRPEHGNVINGFCQLCDGYEAAVFNDNGTQDDTTDDYYEISNAGQLYWFAEVVNRGSSYERVPQNIAANAVLTEDICVNPGSFDSSGNYTSKDGELLREWIMIGIDGYEGSWNGNGHTVSGLYFSNSEACDVGLFGQLLSGSAVRKTGVLNSCFQGNYNVGGIAGASNGLVEACYNTSTISGQSSVGGIVGYSGSGSIRSCYNIGIVSGNYYIGGIAGKTFEAVIENCYSAAITGISENVSEEAEATAATSAQFASGEITWLLNGKRSEGTEENPIYWFQTCGVGYPAFEGQTVYRNLVSGCCEKNGIYAYSNEKSDFIEHTLVEGICIVCGAYEEPILNEAGFYEIGNVGELYWFAQQVNEGRADINGVLTADIVVNPGTFDEKGQYIPKAEEAVRTWTPIGSLYLDYTGCMDGNCHVIRGLFVNNTSRGNVGLFGHLGSKAIVKNLGIEGSWLYGYEVVGGVTGRSYGTVTDCYYNGAVASVYGFVGGIVGSNHGTTTDCYFTGSISVSNEAYKSIAGAIVGNNTHTSLTRPYGTVKNCFYLDTIGFVGIGGEDVPEDAEATAVTATQFASGEITWLLNHSRSEGTEQEPLVWKQTLNSQELPGYSGSVVYYAYADCQATQKSYTNNNYEKQYDHHYNPQGFCDNILDNGLVCDMYQPAVLNDNATTDTAEDDYYEIHNAGQLYWFAQQVNSGNGNINGKLMADIVVNENVLATDGSLNEGDFRPWIMMGDPDRYLSGTFDGQGHTVSGLYCDHSTATDFIVPAFITNVVGGTVRNVGLVDSYIRSSKNYAGGVVGSSHKGTVENCWNEATVISDNGAGGVVGCAGTETTVINCYNTGTIISNERDAAGILVVTGSDITVKNCYNTGTIQGAVGSNPVANNGLTLENSYYLADSEIDSHDGTTAKTAEAFTSGQVAYLLQADQQSHIWGQTCGSGYPTLGGMKVYQIIVCDGYEYSNDPEAPDRPHTFDDKGFCTNLEGQIHYQPAQLMDNCYQISNAGNLYWFAENINNGTIARNSNAVLTADIDLNDRAWTPICSTDLYYNTTEYADTGYTGTFDGAGHVISEMNVTGSATADASFGLFGTLSGTVKNLGINTFAFTGAGGDTRVGAIVGQMIEGAIVENCFAIHGKINTRVNTENGVAGGIAGCNYAAAIRNCFVGDFTFSAGRYGGIVGDNRADGGTTDRPGTVEYCYTDYGTLHDLDMPGAAATGNAAVSSDQFKSGKIAYLLNQGANGSIWGQTIGKDDFPVFGGDEVYQVANCKNDNVYSNINAAVDHIWENGQCAVCQEIGCSVQWNITLQDDFKVNFYVQTLMQSGSLSISFAGEEITYPVDTLPTNEDGQYCVCVNVAAAQMNTAITLTLRANDQTVLTGEYTVRQYCDTILADETHRDYHALIKEMLNYGAATQGYFNYDTENLANDGITGTAATDVPETTEDITVTDKISGFSFYGASLVYRDRIAVRYYFTGDVTGCTFTANGNTYSPVEKDGMHYVEIADILPQDLDQQITLTVTDVNNKTLSVTYGPMNYIVRMNAKGSDNLKNLLKALYNYHLAAKQLSETTA